MGSTHTVSIQATNSVGSDTESWKVTVILPTGPPVIANRIAIVIILFFLHDWRATFVSAIALPAYRLGRSQAQNRTDAFASCHQGIPHGVHQRLGLFTAKQQFFKFSINLLIFIVNIVC
jgi:hypothetical protein